MKPKFCASLAVAHAVLNRIEVPEAAVKEQRVCVLGYENGREHGLALRIYPKEGKDSTICWAENRNSDEIVVYVGEPGEYFTDGHVPTERAYSYKTFFPHDKKDEAAAFIAREARRLLRAAA